MFSHDTSSSATSGLEKFLDAWDLGPDGLSDLHLADVIAVGDLNGSKPVRRDVFFAGMRARADQVGPAAPRARRTGYDVIELGTAFSVITARWDLEIGARVIPLTSDFVIDRSGPSPRCIAYLARQNLLDLL